MKKTERPIITFPNGQTVCPLGQGTWKMGQSAARRHEEIRALQHGIELGMNLVDTAEMYDNEELVGEAVRDCREKVLLVSKVLPSNASYRGTKLACERSLLKLGTEYIDLYLLHWKGRHPYEETYQNVPEFCYSASFDEVAEKGFTLVPSRYIEFVNRDENIDFDTKMKTLQSELRDLLIAEEKSKADLLTVFKELGYEIEL